MLDDLKKQVCAANLELVEHGLVTLTWGNASGRSDDGKHIVIKPSGVSYDNMKPDDMVVLDLDGNRVEGELNPSSDTPTHLALYRAWKGVGGIVHTHSSMATAFAQACRPVPCFGTTHADTFYGEVPLTRFLTEEEVAEDYEGNTGEVILERFVELDPVAVPGVIVSGHAPFTWGKDAHAAVKNGVVLEEVAKMALATEQLNPHIQPLPAHILDKHYMRKHGPNATYGQR
ncbi:MAG: L-ribulose-5-phosphate 4-epimerase [Planctomycetota bacterium]|jgi:L-ribulose-5-phosphate 4-epimerase